jgi:hypothetical protein
VTPELVDNLVADGRLRTLELPSERVAELIENGPPKHYARFVTELYDLHGEVKGKRYVGDKTPGYIRDLPTLNELWPHAKIVHLIRDGRDVALSLLEWGRAERNIGRFPTWNKDPVTTSALYWEWNVRLAREAGTLLSPSLYYELRYESLVANAELECRRLCDFLDLAYDPIMPRFHEGRTKSKRGLSAKKAWLPVTPGLRRWREQMAPGDVARFEAAAGGLLEELGYVRGAAAASDGELRRVARFRQALVDHKRSWRVPQAWERLPA